jgi:uncharacterized membrane protein YhhN
MLVAEELENPVFVFIIKPFIVLSLGIYLYQYTQLTNRFYKLIFAGLFFSWLGDIFLMFSKENPIFFMMGLIAFLLAHVSYIFAFIINFNIRQTTGFIVAGIMLAFSMLYFRVLYPYLDSMLYPVMAYIIIISVMAVTAAFRRANGWQMVLLGAFCFVVSDSLLAYNKFVHSLPHAGLLVMASYMIAQFLITLGGIRYRSLSSD